MSELEENLGSLDKSERRATSFFQAIISDHGPSILRHLIVSRSKIGFMCRNETMAFISSKAKCRLAMSTLEMFLGRTYLSKIVDGHGMEFCHVFPRCSKFLATIFLEQGLALGKKGCKQ